MIEALTANLRATPAIARVAIAEIVAYRAEMTIWILTNTLPLVMLALWHSVADGRVIAGYGQLEFTRYFVATLVVRQLTGAWILWEMNHLIRTGGLSPKLLRPVDPIWQSAMTMLAALPLRVLILSPIIIGLLAWQPEAIAVPSIAGAALFVVSVALAWMIAFLVQVCFALLAFWIDQSMGLFGVWYAAWTLLSGYVAPLATFPDGLQNAVRWLPFRAMLGTPVELAGGFATPAELWPDVLAQAAWAAGLLALAIVMWRRGIRHYGAYGA